MIKTAFTCNSLTIKQFLRFLLVRACSFRSGKLRNICLKETAKFFGVKTDRIFLYASARMGLYSLLSWGDDKEKDEVIVAGYTCVVVTNAIKYADLKAVYIDIEEESLNIDPVLLRAAINKRTKAIIFTHNFGITCEYIHEFKKEFPGILIIEDAAHTFGSTTRDGIKAGLLGDASFFSLEYSKPLSSGMGGIILVNDLNLKKKLRESYEQLGYYPASMRFRIALSLMIHVFSSSRYNAFLKKWMSGFLYLTGLLYKSPPGELQGERPKHYPVRLSAGLAYIAALQIRNIKKVNEIKAGQARIYFENFKNIRGLKQYYAPHYNFARYPILFEQEVPLESISKIKRSLKLKGIHTGEWFNDVVHPRGSLRYCYLDGSCGVGESIADRMINLPISIHKQLNDKDLAAARQIILKQLNA